MKNKAIISIIIPCFNGEKYIKNCLESILKSKFSNYEAIIVDDGSTDSSIELIKELFINELKSLKLKIIENKNNLGPAQARNIGAKKAKGKYLFFLDVDTKIEPHCLTKIAEKFGQNHKIGALQVNLDTAGHFLSYFGFPYEIQAAKKEKLIFGARTAGMAVRKKLFEKINGFDGDYFIYGEDTDLSWRIWLSGYQVLYLPQAKAYHFQKSSLNKKTKYRLFYEGAKNNLSNIVKNAPLKILIWILPLHLFAWILLSLKLIFQRRLKEANWIYKGLLWNLKNLKKTLKKRRKIASYAKKNNECIKIMFNPFLTSKESLRSPPRCISLFLKGWRWFKNV